MKTHLDSRAAQPRRLGLSVAAGIHALAFAAAAATLPWTQWSAFSITSGLLAAHHGVVGVAALGPASWLMPAWRALSWASLAFLVGWGWAAFSSAQYLAGLYGSLGQGIGAVLGAAYTPIVAFTLPFAIWGLGATRHEQTPRRGKWWIVLLAATAGTSWWARGASRTRSLINPAERARLVAGLGEALAPPRAGVREPDEARRVLAPADCDTEGPAAIVWAREQEGPRCLTASSIDALRERLVEFVATRHGMVSVDLITATAELNFPNSAVAPLALRPGRDGVCGDGRCLTPWQLVGLELFTTHRVVPFIADLRAGVDLDRVREALGVGSQAVLHRIETKTWRIDPQRETAVQALGAKTSSLDEAMLRRAWTAVESHVLRAQRIDGAFRYKLHAVTGQTGAGRSIARQAGTLLVLCQLGERTPAVAAAVQRGFDALARERVEASDLSFMSGRADATQVRLGPTALTLAALVTCRERLTPSQREWIASMIRFVVAVQRPDGSFARGWDRERAERHDGPQVLFAAGQATFALALVAAADDLSSMSVGVRPALARAMRHYAHDYWAHPAASLFFVEENWHCLAAAATPADARNDAYEQFCLDYVQFKRRLLLDAESDVDPHFVGGYGFGNLIAPHTTATAGLAEALAAAVQIADARGDTALGADLRGVLRAALTNLVARQWDEARCHACVRPAATLGGFTESPASPVMRIDYAQHAWAALGHGGRALGVLPESAERA